MLSLTGTEPPLYPTHGIFELIQTGGCVVLTGDHCHVIPFAVSRFNGCAIPAKSGMYYR